MEAAKALLRATGLLEKSTATEHATSSSRPDPAASTDEIFFFLGDKASENRFWLGDKDLDKIVALLMWMAQDIANVFSVDNAKTQIALDKHGVSSNMHDVVSSSAP